MKNLITKFAFALSVMLVLFGQNSYGQSFPQYTIKNNGSVNDKINIVFLPDGYKSSDLNKFETRAQMLYNGIVGADPFNKDATRFNGFYYKVPSNTSGAGSNGISNGNYFGSKFPRHSSSLIYSNLNTVNQFIAEHLPLADVVIILVNDSRFGAASSRRLSGFIGSTVVTIASAYSNTNQSKIDQVCHELGHALGGLGDEYNSNFSSFTAPNRSNDGNPSTVSWKNYIGQNGVGVYPFTGRGAGWYKPHTRCKMNFSFNDFCLVCNNALNTEMNAITSVRKLEKPKHMFIPNKSHSSFYAVWVAPLLATSYEVQYYDENGWSTSYFTNSPSITISGGYYAGYINLRVRALGSRNGKSKWAYLDRAVDFGYKLNTPENLNVPGAASYGLYLNYDAVSNASDYEIKYSFSGKSGTNYEMSYYSTKKNSYNWFYGYGDAFFFVRALNAQGEYSNWSSILRYSLPSSAPMKENKGNENMASITFEDLMNQGSHRTNNHESINQSQLSNTSSITDEFKILPNPATNNLSVSNTYGSPVTMKMYSITGQMVREVNLDLSTLVNISDLTEGVYVLKFYSLSNNSVPLGHKKLVIN